MLWNHRHFFNACFCSLFNISKSSFVKLGYFLTTSSNKFSKFSKLFEFFEFKETIKAANLRYLYDLENDNENALQRFNDLIKVRFPDLTFPSFSYFNIYVKTKNKG